MGVNADHDSRYARVLFKIGGLRGQGTLYEKFEEVLARMGIEIEFSHGHYGEPVEEDERSQFDVEEERQSNDGFEGHQGHGGRGRQRRNSESTAWDLSMQTPAKAGRRRRSFSPTSRNNAPPGQIAPPILAPLPPLPEQMLPTPAIQAKEEEHEHPIRTWLNQQDPSRRPRNRSVSTHQSLRIHRRAQTSRSGHRQPKITPSIPASDGEGYQAADEDTAVTSAEEEIHPDPGIARPQQPFARPSFELMETKALVLRQCHLSSKARRAMRSWREQAMEAREYYIALEDVAGRHDSNVLLQQALQTWRGLTTQRRRAAETERFFKHLGQRADKARDQYLLAKAFTHWAACSLEQAKLTAVARRHILRFRVFNAWRDITVANELKVRRQRLNKFLEIWKDRQASLANDEELAVVIYQGNLVKRVVKAWFREHSCVQFQKHSDLRLKSRILRSWKDATQDVEDNDRFADYERRRRLVASTWRVWKRKAQERTNHDAEAVEYYEVTKCSNVLRRWRRETSIEPAKKTVMTEVRRRILSESFFLWLHRTRQERQAGEVDRMRMLREAFTTWRHQGRCKRHRQIFDARAASHAINTWRLAARLKVQEQIRDHRLVRRCLDTWIEETHVTRERRWEQEHHAEDYDVQAIQRQVIVAWRGHLQSFQDREQEATDFYETKLLSRILLQWKDRMPHQLTLQDDCRRATFWFSVRKAFKQWRSATEIARRQKRKAAYVQIRRTVKMNLARSMLFRWRDKAKQVSGLEAQAQEALHNKTIVVGMNTFDRWRARAEEVAELESMCKERVLRKHLFRWRDRSFAFQDLSTEAILSFQETQQSRAFKKWNLRLLQINSQSLYALEIRERNAKRAFRKIFTYWNQRTAQRRPTVRAETPGQRPELGITARAEAWSDFGDEVEVDELTRRLFESRNTNTNNPNKKLLPVPQTPMPGYLATPSKRMERVSAAAARFGSTTPRVPLSTPAERLLRAQWSGDGEGNLSRRGRGVLGGSALGGGFRDIPDNGSGVQEDDE